MGLDPITTTDMTLSTLLGHGIPNSELHERLRGLLFILILFAFMLEE